MVTTYSQRDTEWAYEGLGNKLNPTLGEAGCLVTAVASVVTDFGDQPLSPGYLNDWLRRNKGFRRQPVRVRQRGPPRPGSWSSYAVAVAARAHCGPGRGVEGRSRHRSQVDSTPGGPLNSHWVRLLRVDEQDGQIMDPWQLPGKEFVPFPPISQRVGHRARHFHRCGLPPKPPAVRGAWARIGRRPSRPGSRR